MEQENKNHQVILNQEDINQAIQYSRISGKANIDWNLMKEYIQEALLNVLNSKYEIEINEAEADKENNIESYLQNAVAQNRIHIKPEATFEDIQEQLVKLKKAPFTLQRICELLQEPFKFYKTRRKFLSAFLKLVDVEI
jgi:hypothetical protein